MKTSYNTQTDSLLQTMYRLSLSICSRIFWLLLTHPHYLWGTMWATVNAIQITQKQYSEPHNGNNKANAFKHALWNALLAQKTQFWHGNSTQPLEWAKKVTDIHEDCFRNSEAMRQADFANNALGRKVYQKLYENQNKKPSTSEIIEGLLACELDFVVA